MTEYGFSFALEGFQTAFLIAVTAYSSVSVMDMPIWFVTYCFFSWVLMNENHYCP